MGLTKNDFFKGASIGTDLIGGIFNYKSQKKALQQQMKMQQMNFDFQREMFDKQVSYNKEMWNAENAYNTPLAQANRLLQAGLNPYLAMGGSNTGTASGVNGTSPYSGNGGQLIAPQLNTGRASDTLANMVSQDEQLKAMKLDNEKRQIDNIMRQEEQKWQVMNIMMDINEQLSRTNDNDARANLNWILGSLEESLMGVRVGQAVANVANTEADTAYKIANTALVKAENKLKSLDIKYYDARYLSEKALMAAKIAETKAREHASWKEAKMYIASALDLEESAVGKRIDNQVKNTDEYKNAKLNHIIAESMEHEYKALLQGQKQANHSIYGVEDVPIENNGTYNIGLPTPFGFIGIKNNTHSVVPNNTTSNHGLKPKSSFKRVKKKFGSAYKR